MRPMPIIRSRTGCFTCRRRKKKCNEEKPICSGCKRNKLECNWPADTSSNSSASQKRAGGAAAAPGSKAAVSPQDNSKQEQQELLQHTQDGSQFQPGPQPQYQTGLDLENEPDLSSPLGAVPPRPAPSLDVPGDNSSTPGPGSDDTDMAETDDQLVQPSPSPSSSHSSGASADSLSASPAFDYDQDSLDAMALVAAPVPSSPDADPSLLASGISGITMTMPMLPEHGHQSYELLSYYLARTANSMGNGSTEINPFIAKLIPLSFSSPLVLQLILAQSAAHRQASDDREPTNQVAQRYYTDSLRMFRNVVNDYMSGKEENTLVLTVGSLILCLTEVARGDIHGTVFDHLTASKSLLSMLLARNGPDTVDDLPDFLVEYYMHIAASSMISIDPHYTSQSLLSPEIEQMARKLVERKYIGQLSGCWLELLVIIPQVFQLGQSMMAIVDGHPVPPSPDNIVQFGFLQSQAMGFFPDQSVTPYARLAGLVFKQAVLLYLWTILGTPQMSNENSSHKAIMDAAVSDAVTLLAQLPATVRVNTSLCWPLAVIGCCTSSLDIQQVLRLRLQTMIDTIGLGNMRETLTLLEHVWRLPLEEISPWTLCKAMRDHQIWISFA